ncbi:MAG: gliding motility-associated C-terminal domain-containing protein [Candidatus Peribacteria bacterium]|nr:MAG: gliding motility-associated C-terminal domain-containing protein [Candidatus Peribacteria bacterium]
MVSGDSTYIIKEVCDLWELHVTANSTCELTAGGGVIYEVNSVIDTFLYGVVDSQWGKDTLALVGEDSISILGYLDFGASDDCLTATVVKKKGICETVLCGELISYAGNQGYIHRFPLDIATGTWIIDIGTATVVDTFIFVINGDTIINLAWGGDNLLTGGLVGPFLWDNGVFTFYPDDPDAIPYWRTIGVKKNLSKNYNLGLARFIITVPPNICKGEVTMASNGGYTVWDMFKQCCVDCVPVPPMIVSKDTSFCGFGYIDDALFAQDSLYIVHSTTLGGCSLETQWHITVYPVPQLEVATLPQKSCQDVPITVMTTATDPVKVTSLTGWSAETDGNITLPLTAMLTGFNTLGLSVENAWGCQYDTLISFERVFCDVYFPTALSPNNDGINDTYYPQAGEGVVDEVIEMAIYDRWGDWVWRNQAFQVNDPLQGWDGSFRKKVCEQDVLVYRALLRMFDGTERLYMGGVTLVR